MGQFCHTKYYLWRFITLKYSCPPTLRCWLSHSALTSRLASRSSQPRPHRPGLATVCVRDSLIVDLLAACLVFLNIRFCLRLNDSCIRSFNSIIDIHNFCVLRFRLERGNLNIENLYPYPTTLLFIHRLKVCLRRRISRRLYRVLSWRKCAVICMTVLPSLLRTPSRCQRSHWSVK